MKKNKSIKFKTDDKIVVFICTLGIIISLVCYFADVYHVNIRKDDEPIAFLTSKIKSVQRRFKDRLVWDILRPDSPLYAGDFVKTSTFSEAVITFKSGTIINMSQDSLVEILPETENMHLKISSGNVAVTAKQKTTITAGSEILELEEGAVVAMNVTPVLELEDNYSISLANEDFFDEDSSTKSKKDVLTNVSAGDSAAKSSNRNSAKKISVSVKEGNIRQTKSDGSVVKINAGSQIVVGSDGKISIDPAVIVHSPKPLQQVLHKPGENAQVLFELDEVNYTKDIKTLIELSYDKEFEYIFDSKEIQNQKNTSFLIPNRTLYWRSYPVLDGEPLGLKNEVSGVIKVNAVVPIKKLEPFEGVTYSYKNAQNSIRFSWTGDDLAEAYLLTIADNPGLKNPIIQKQIVGTYASLGGFENGRWYWQIDPIYSENSQGNGISLTGASSFTVLDPITLMPPVLLKPSTKEIIYTASGRQPILFSWQNAVGAKNYTFLISSNKDFKNPIVKMQTNQNYLSITPSKVGLTQDATWYWTVYFTDADGNNSPYSTARTFTTLNDVPYFESNSPKNNLVIEQNKLNTIDFVVRTNLPLASCITVAKDSSFSEIVFEGKIKGLNCRLDGELEKGFYYWKFTTEDGSYSSETKCFYITDESEESTALIEIDFETVHKQSFLMGNKDGTTYERPVRTVLVDSFEISKAEISQNIYNVVMGLDSDLSDNNLPATNVSWFDAIEFCNRLSILKGLNPVYSVNGSTVIFNANANGYRLPTEAEWELAATKEKGTIWCKDNSQLISHEAEENVLCNMKGNVAEWCFDIFGYYRNSDTANPIGAESGTKRAVRGGSFLDASQKCTNTFRESRNPNTKSATIGFRIVRSL